MLLSNIPLCEFIYLPIDGHLGGLQFLAIMNISTVNIIYMSLWNMFSFLLYIHLEVYHWMSVCLIL